VSRDVELWLNDIDEACARVTEYVGGMTYESFTGDRKTIDAVIRNLEIIGEAVKQLPEDFRTAHVAIPWRKISGLRDILAHAYFGVDEQIIWDVVTVKVPDLARFVKSLPRPPA
jgi:uncharacterized protein with HEPN domain